MIYLKTRKFIVILLTFAMVSGMAAADLLCGHEGKAVITSNSIEHESLEHSALVYLLTNELQEHTDRFYEPYYTLHPTIAYYMTTVKNVSNQDGQINITFSTLPYIGPHDTIGEDEITLGIRHSGEIALVDFKHLKSYPLPENLRSLEKGALPPATESRKSTDPIKLQGV